MSIWLKVAILYEGITSGMVIIELAEYLRYDTEAIATVHNRYNTLVRGSNAVYLELYFLANGQEIQGTADYPFRDWEDKFKIGATVSIRYQSSNVKKIYILDHNHFQAKILIYGILLLLPLIFLWLRTSTWHLH
jgi:hypothetical protein